MLHFVAIRSYRWRWDVMRQQVLGVVGLVSSGRLSLAFWGVSWPHLVPYRVAMVIDLQGLATGISRVGPGGLSSQCLVGH